MSETASGRRCRRCGNAMDPVDPASDEAMPARAGVGVAVIAAEQVFHCPSCGTWSLTEKLGDGTRIEHDWPPVEDDW